MTESSSARLSTRISLAWPPEPPTETTDTLVLSLNGWYVDLRIDKATSEIDWAIAGERVVDSHDSNKVQFTHLIDSHNSFEDVDCGSFSTLPNGDDLEVGWMARPDVPGKTVAAYEEVWRELDKETKFDRSCGRVSWILGAVSPPISFSSQSQGVEEKEEVATRTFLGRVWGAYICVSQEMVVVIDEGRGSGNGGLRVQEGRNVSARREEHSSLSGKWEVLYSAGSGDGLPSMNRITEEEQRGWKAGERVMPLCNTDNSFSRGTRFFFYERKF